ncbi:DNA translocase SftA [Barrientosiimonas marina]|uniref:DNA translocase FtsK n=1 Tax=Lentibacillus kimchii TaxID=1542911 RepID=A0ABW2UY93_9BACI
MFDQWKRKIRHFLFEEQENENEKPSEPTNKLPKRNQDIQTRMTYQYPKEKPFRFPVIPDEKNGNDQSDTPAFQRRQHQAAPEDEQPVKQEEEENEPVRKKIEPEYDEPFKPSDVPSPIHGFQRSYNTDGFDNVPAFQRKSAAREDTYSERPRDEAKEETAAAIEELNNDEEVSGYSESVSDDGSTMAEQDDASDVESVHDETAAQSKSDDALSYSKPSEPETAETRETASPQPNKQRSKEPGKSQPNTETPPFNVLMSANDKRSYSERRRNKRSQTSETRDVTQYEMPIHLLDDPEPGTDQDQLWMEDERQLLEKTLKYFHVRADVVNTTQGPSVTRFEVQPELGVKVSKIKNLSDDLKLNMAAKDIRIEAPIPGKNTIGIEIPNQHPRTVSLQEIFTDQAFQTNTSPLTVGLGLSIEGEPRLTNIQKMPHGLIAGATGSGKSVCINTILISLIYNASHEDVKFMLIDPKMVELAPYNGIPHLISPVITDVKAATAALKWAVRQMEERYEAFVRENVRDVERFNKKMTQQNRPGEKMPYMVIVIDELADLMMIAPQDVEDSISRIAQKARACGIHLLLATQRPSVDVITGLIKANIPTRIAFSVSSQVDSKTILDTGGAEKLLGKGDMLFTENGAGKSVRLQGAFVSDEEIDRVTDYARSVAEPDYQFEQEELLQHASEEDEADELLNDAIMFVVEHNSASTSLLQRQFKIGYNRAARLMDAMEERGIIAEQNGSKPREVLVSAAQFEN